MQLQSEWGFFSTRASMFYPTILATRLRTKRWFKNFPAQSIGISKFVGIPSLILWGCQIEFAYTDERPNPKVTKQKSLSTSQYRQSKECNCRTWLTC